MTHTSQNISHLEPVASDINLLSGILRATVLPTAICIGGMIFFSVLPAKAQSFPCAKAEQTAEFAICNDENLLTLDEQLGREYASKYVNASTSPQRQAVTREQMKWLKKRNQCGHDFTCLSLRYEERLQRLRLRSS